jgi:hypothetical protein
MTVLGIMAVLGIVAGLGSHWVRNKQSRTENVRGRESVRKLICEIQAM